MTTYVSHILQCSFVGNVYTYAYFRRRTIVPFDAGEFILDMRI